ncbi:hypothetical protein ACOSQ2_021716 [Xanthoceras sorbifolium]
MLMVGAIAGEKAGLNLLVILSYLQNVTNSHLNRIEELCFPKWLWFPVQDLHRTDILLVLGQSYYPSVCQGPEDMHLGGYFYGNNMRSLLLLFSLHVVFVSIYERTKRFV